MIVPKGFLRRFEVWLLLAAAIVVLAVACSGCTNADAPERKPEPEPSSVLRHWQLSRSANVTEFRDSGGRMCTALRTSYGAALDCDELRPMQYEDLPEEK